MREQTANLSLSVGPARPMARLRLASARAAFAFLAAAVLISLPEVRSVETSAAGEGVLPCRMTVCLQSDQDFVCTVSEGEVFWSTNAKGFVVPNATGDSALPGLFSATYPEEGGRKSLRISSDVWCRTVRRELSRKGRKRLPRMSAAPHPHALLRSAASL